MLIALTGFGGLVHAQNDISVSCAGKAALDVGHDRTDSRIGRHDAQLPAVHPVGLRSGAADAADPEFARLCQHAAQQVLFSQWNELAEAEDLIVVYPQGTGSPARWNAGQTEIPGLPRPRAQGALTEVLSHFFETVQVDDVAFIRDLIAHLSDQLCVDAARIYANGLSNGGGMTNRLACELADEIAAVGTVAGAYTEFPGGCNPSRPMPVIAFHGVVDPIVPYEGNAQIHFPAIATWAADWAARDLCDPTPETIDGTVGAVTGIRYIDCADNAEVDFYTIADGGHTWPGGFPIPAFLVGKTSQDIDASATMWTFFQAHPLN